MTRTRGFQPVLLGLLAPTAVCAPVALLAEFAGFSKRLGLDLFFRPSEVQELFFYLFVLIYLVDLRRRMRLLDP